MAITSPVISVISDEIARDLDDVLAFAAGEKLTHLEVRQLDGANFLMLDDAALTRAARRIRDAGVTVSALATPLLKWPGPGQPFAFAGDTFGFDPRGRDTAGHMAAACTAAKTFGASRLRIFSYLTYPGFAPDDLAADLGVMLDMADAASLDLMLETEPVCNVQRTGELEAVLARFPHPRLKALVDLGNLASVGEAPEPAAIARLMPRADHLHVKDWSRKHDRPMVLGEGDIGFAAFLADCLVLAGPRQLTLSIETHVPADRMAATRRSLAELRRIVARVETDAQRVRVESLPYGPAGR